MSVKITGTQQEGVPTRALTADQRGWAKERWPRYYYLKGARWKINPEQPAIPIPVRLVVQEVPEAEEAQEVSTEDNKPRRRRRHG